jgi:hypothetical protein
MNRLRHQHEQHDTHRPLLGIEPVGDPGGEDPQPPHRQHQQAGLDRAAERQVRQQAVRELGDGEHEHQVEEQLDEGDPRRGVAAAGPQEVLASVHQGAFSTAAQAAGSFGR